MNALASRQMPANAQGELQGAVASLYSLSSIFGPPLMTQVFGYFSQRRMPRCISPALRSSTAALLTLGCAAPVRARRCGSRRDTRRGTSSQINPEVECCATAVLFATVSLARSAAAAGGRRGGCGAAADPTRVRAGAREHELLAHLRARTRRRAVSRPYAPGAGGAAHAVLRDRTREPRQLRGDDQRPGAQPRDAARLPDVQRFPADAAPALNAYGQALGSGCVYPPIVKACRDQLEAAGLTWRAYMEDMGNDPRRERASCGHVPVGAADPTSVAQRGDQYAAKHDPFVYFHSIIDDPARCEAHVVNLDRLPRGSRSAATTPNYVFITPNLCNDGHDRQVRRRPARAGCWRSTPSSRSGCRSSSIPPAFRADGMLIVTFDEADGGRARGLGRLLRRAAAPRRALRTRLQRARRRDASGRSCCRRS